MLLLVPVFDPFTCHWYEGVVPPFDGIAVYVTEVLAHTVSLVAVIATITGRIGLTVSVISFESEVLPVVQFSLEVSVKVTISPLLGK